MPKFIQKKSLCAAQGHFVITDEQQSFEWVGSSGALPCIILLIEGFDDYHKKIAACGHLSQAESPRSIDHMIEKMQLKEINFVYLISGQSSENNNVSVTHILTYLRKHNIKYKCDLGNGMTQAALNVKTGEVTTEVAFKLENTGKGWNQLELYFEKALTIPSTVPDLLSRPYLSLAIDARNKLESRKTLILIDPNYDHSASEVDIDAALPIKNYGRLFTSSSKKIAENNKNFSKPAIKRPDCRKP